MDRRGRQRPSPDGEQRRWLASARNVGMGALIAGGGTALFGASDLFIVWLLELVNGPWIWFGLLFWPGTAITYLVLSNTAISRAPAGQRWARFLGVVIVPFAVFGIFVVHPYFQSRSQNQNQDQASSMLDEFTPDLDLDSWRTLRTGDLGRCSVGAALTSRREQGNAADSFAWTQDVLAHLEGTAKWDVETAHIRKTEFVGRGETETSFIYATRDGASALFVTTYRPRRGQGAADADGRVRASVGGCAGEQSIEDAIVSYYTFLWGPSTPEEHWDHWSDALPDQVPDPISNR